MEAVAHYRAMARSGAIEEAFHGLRELGPDTLPARQSAYLDEADPMVRTLVVEAIWQHRQPSTIDFLANALRDPAPPVWKQALDGLVALASPATIRALQLAYDEETDPECRAWMEEALGQMDDAVVRPTAP